MAQLEMQWNRQTLVADIALHYKQANICQLSYNVWCNDNKLTLSTGSKRYEIPNTSENIQLLGDVILDLSKKKEFDRIITTKSYGDVNLTPPKQYKYQWMKRLLTNDFTSLIQMDKDGYAHSIPYESYDIICDMISRDKLITACLSISKNYSERYEYDYVYSHDEAKWLVDESKLLNAIKSTNTLKEIFLGGWSSCGNSITSWDAALEKLLKEALPLNFSVTCLTREDNMVFGCDITTQGHHKWKVSDRYSKWWPSIKKRNEESQRFNKILFGDEKDEGVWNNHKCPYNVASQVLKRHFPSIPSLFFDKEGDRCFCFKCHTKRKDKIVYKRGKPPKQYALPIGWTRFGLKTDDAKCLMNNVWSDWHVAFHGTTKHVVPLIFKGGLLLLKPGDITISGDELSIRGGHIPKPFERFNKFTQEKEVFDPNQIYVSPSMTYSGHAAYAKKFYISHPEDKNRTITAQCAFQLRIRPGAYGIGQETVGAARQGKTLDANFSNNELGWYTKENIGIVLQGLLFRIKEINVPLKKLQKEKKIEVDSDDEKKEDK
eukprot:762722_1